ncbi:lytic polysaccharide monooxygenase [Streptomyces sp. DSM 41524]|uniref:Lytic polysaccharide monooxygenase n=1 Tax=Streptomyces asiaticus subsp. ignotus TaxID=3098222 RepID=A0ABU7Q1Z6_9ACTN|nr:lytic polysaccharide monooxygenase [Streptomyces sp. DSM 41524]
MPGRRPNIGGKFTVKLYDQASHGADYLKVCVSRQGYDPTTQPLKWSDPQLVTTTGKYAPSQNYAIDVSTSGYTGRHVVYTIWQSSHSDQTYFLCSEFERRLEDLRTSHGLSRHDVAAWRPRRMT